MQFKSALAASAILVLSFSALVALPGASAFTFGSQYGAYTSSAAASDYYGIQNYDNSSYPGDGHALASSSESASDSVGGSASASSSVDAATHSISGAAAADCTGSDDCYDTYFGGYFGLGGSTGGSMYDTYTATCASCSDIDMWVSWTITGTFGSLDDGPVCQGTAVPETIGAVACQSTFDSQIWLGNTPLCQGYQGSSRYSLGCPPTMIDYQQGWGFCQGGSAAYYYYCPSGTSFTLSGSIDLSNLIFQSCSYSCFSSAYLSSGGTMQVGFLADSDAFVNLPGDESVTGSFTFSVYSATPGVTVTSAASGTQTTTPPESSTTTVQVNPTSVPVGSPTTVQATVAGLLASPTGTVSWTSSGLGTFSSDTCTLVGTRCSVTFTPTSAGGSPQTITASYGGDGGNLASSGTGSLNVLGQSTETYLNCSPNPVAAGSASSCTATVSGGSSPGGTVSFGTSSGTGSFSPSNSCTLVSGSCSVSYTDTSSGSPYITATYSGDAVNSGSNGYTYLTISGSAHTSSTSLVCAKPHDKAAPITCTVTVTDTSSSPVAPSGQVAFSSNRPGSFSSGASCYLSGGEEDTVNGAASASCSLTFTPSSWGPYKITGAYQGDYSHSGSSRTIVMLVLP